MQAAASQRALRIATSPTVRSILTCVAVCAVRSVSGVKAPARARNMKSCCD